MRWFSPLTTAQAKAITVDKEAKAMMYKSKCIYCGKPFECDSSANFIGSAGWCPDCLKFQSPNNIMDCLTAISTMVVNVKKEQNLILERIERVNKDVRDAVTAAMSHPVEISLSKMCPAKRVAKSNGKSKQ